MNPSRLSPLFALTALSALMALQNTCRADSGRVHERLDAAWRFERLDPSVRTTLTSGVAVTNWRWIADDSGSTDAAKMADPALDTTGPDWKDAKTGDDVFHGRIGFAWFRTTLDPIIPGKTARKIHFEGVDDNATVYLNGVQIVHHEGWNDAFDVSLAQWRPGGPNVLAVLVENTGAGGGITGDVSLTVNTPGDAGSAPEAVTPHEAGVSFDDHAWRTVHLPHDYVVEGTFDPNGDTGHGALPTGNAWYRKQFSIPATAKGKVLWLDFEGVYRDCTVWLNGTPLGNHPCGYTGFQLDITKAAHYGGENLLAVYVNARTSEGWWYEGGGIYRHVWLDMANPVHIAQYGTFVTSTISGLGSGQTPLAVITIKTTVTNDGANPKRIWLESIVTRPDKPNNRAIYASVSSAMVPAGTSIDVTQTVQEPKALLWSLETPQLYHLTSVVRVNKTNVDTTDTPFGVRSIRFDADKGFFLNEKPVKIQGTCNHQDFAGLGVALPDGILAWRVKKLKEMGSNAYRTSHNEVAPALLDACDKQGMLVMDETRHLGDGEAGKASASTKAEDLLNWRQQIMQDRNHPSIVLWSDGNEEFSVQATDAGERLSTAMKRVLYQLDGTRPMTQAITYGYDKGSSKVLDIEGINYSPQNYDAYHQSNPNHPMIGSETASALSTRGIYATDKVAGYVDAYDDNNPNWGETAENAWRPIAERPYVAGGFVWTGFDYKGEPTPYTWPCINSAFGIMDMCGFPKDTYYYYQSVWGTKPMAHLLPHWNWAGQEGKPIDVWAYSNGDSVELFLNGASLGSQAMPKNGHVQWSVPYQPGKLEAKASQNGEVIATDSIETTGAPAALRLTTDRDSILADGEDASPIKVSVVDAQGRVVPTADNLVTFNVSGPGSVVGVGNGNPSSHEPDKASMRHAFNGLCLVIVGASDAPGGVRVTATADGLQPATLTIKTTAP